MKYSAIVRVSLVAEARPHELAVLALGDHDLALAGNRKRERRPWLRQVDVLTVKRKPLAQGDRDRRPRELPPALAIRTRSVDVEETQQSRWMGPTRNAKPHCAEWSAVWAGWRRNLRACRAITANIYSSSLSTGMKNFCAGQQRGKVVFFLTAHVGAWGLSSFAHALYGYPLYYMSIC